MADPDTPPKATDMPAPKPPQTPTQAPVPPKPPAPEKTEASPKAPPPVKSKSGGIGAFVGLLAGGAVAAGGGFALARYGVPPDWPPGLPATPMTLQLAEQATKLAENQAGLAAVQAELAKPKTDSDAVARLDALEAAIAAVKAMDPKLAAIDSRLTELGGKFDGHESWFSDLEKRFAESNARIDALDARLSALEKQPTAEGGVSNSALQAYERDLAALRDEIKAQSGNGAEIAADINAAAAAAEARIAEAEAKSAALKAEAEAQAAAMQAEAEAKSAALKAEADAAVRGAKLTTALNGLNAAAESGAPYADLVAVFQTEGQELPPALLENAETGMPTLAAVQEAFPAAARAALNASLHANMGATVSERIAAFLRTQTGARSLTPHEGTDPDAVLSRAEQALRNGDLSAAFAETAGLPPEGQAALTEWRAMADRRLAVTEALAAVAAAIAQQ
ncbi:COG4223 family protein [Rhodobacter ferrooxidans]|uniref:Mitochondrial inner membrane protein n=1 Tax=Rhodobacter ferrooxidans TaxID=371731 RepID=C8S119_9RHOB|nr:hypothetical protein [Rhodobacter sp. SW2]EEW25217.1 conserved hypothetical protein [Rhodobacter sp. SW2]